LTESTPLHEAHSFGTRFENGLGTNPEELLAAAHAGCFAIAVPECTNLEMPPAARNSLAASVDCRPYK
jgi:lipoyl-dependent peroxiredoxin